MIPKKNVIIFSVIGFVLAGVASYLIFTRVSGPNVVVPYKPPTANGGTESQSGSTEPLTAECPMNGKMYPESQKAQWETRRPLFIMVENHVEARPQSGLSSADVIYEMVAEGGITRFGNVFYCEAPKTVGPVRSARVHFLKFAQEYGNNPLYAHVGGANCDPSSGSGCLNGAKADALGLIAKLDWDGYNDLNQFSVPFPNFWRDNDRLPNRATEHTVYTDTTKLWQYAKDKRGLTNVDKNGLAWDTTFAKWKFRDEAKATDRGTVDTISYGFWNNNIGSDFAVTWRYDKATNTYKRENGGAPHMDRNSNKQLEVKNVIVGLAVESPANDGYEGGHLLYKLEGKGDAIVFQDGKATKATWEKKDPKTKMRWFDQSGKEIDIVRGKVWVSMLPIENKIIYGDKATVESSQKSTTDTAPTKKATKTNNSD